MAEDRDTTLIEEELKRHAMQRFRRLAALPLGALDAPPDELRLISDGLVRFVTGHRDAVRAFLERCLDEAGAPGPDALTAFLVAQTVKLFEGRNQFIAIDAESQRTLVSIYRRHLGGFLAAVKASDGRGDLAGQLAGVETVLHADLAACVHELSTCNPGRAFVLSEPASGRYTPEGQLRVLGLEPGALCEPVLDLGCGGGAGLVRYLQARGVKAIGVDRDLGPGNGLMNADWLDTPLGSACWGTIISHMAFSLHFLHHHLRPGGEAGRYARRHMEILRAVAPGGSFVYAPGLPFIEELLPPSQYEVTRTPIAALAGSAADAALREAFGTGVLYACRVKRLKTVSGRG